MFKSRVFLCILGLLLCLCTTSEARVCFLASGTDASGNATNCIGGGVIEDFVETVPEACPNKEECVIPKLNAASCSDNGVRFYDPVDCCTNTSIYEVCNPELGYVCSESSCQGIDEEGKDYVSCPIGNCVCGADFTETCDGVGQRGVGVACGGKYRSCECDKSQFFKCGANSSPSGSTCTDSTGTYHSSCNCPTVDGDNWVSNPDECCSVSSTTCVSRPDGKTIYKCNPDPMFSCQCGYTYSKAGCQSGCTDSTFNYFGSSANVVCAGGYIPYLNTNSDGICGNGCTCAVGYWDYYETCNKSDDNICAQLGYTDTNCVGDYLSCPFDAGAKKCLDVVVGDEPESGCEFDDQVACETKNTNSLCAQGTDGCFVPVSCREGFYKTLNEASCPDGDFGQVGGADANGCGYCATEYKTCIEAGYADAPIANGTKKAIYLADGTLEENCFVATEQADCEDAFFNSTCEENEEGEWVHTGCKVPSITTCPESGRLATDMAGCTTCESKCLYVDKSACTAKNKNSVCEPDADGCYVPTICAPISYTEANDTNCGTQGRYYDKLVDIDANGCGKCGSSYTTCEDWGYIDDTWSHIGSDRPSDVGAGSAFQFWTSEGTVRECWALDVDCAYSSSSDCTTKNPNGKCSLQNGCYELASCNKNYALMNGKCERIYFSLEECEAANPGFVCEKVWSESGYGEGYHYAPNGTCKSNYMLYNNTCQPNCPPGEYASLEDCQTDNVNSACEPAPSECFYPNTCRDGFTRVCQGGTLKYLDGSSCGICTYATPESCEDELDGFACEFVENEYGESYYVPTDTCKSGYALSTDGKSCVASNPCANIGLGEGWYPSETCASTCNGSCASGSPAKYYNASSSGISMKECLKCCTYSDQTACEEANSGFACELDENGACYAPTTSCKSGYTLTDGKCVVACADGTYATEKECQEAHPGYKCTANSDNCYVTDGCLRGYSAWSNSSIGSNACRCNREDDSNGLCASEEWVLSCTTDANGCVVPGECIADTQEKCEAKYKYTRCDSVGSGTECWLPYTCNKTNGYTQIAGQCGDDENNYDMDEFGCGKCICEDGYKLVNGECVADTPTCASGEVYANGACQKIETCEQYNLVPLTSSITPGAETSIGGDVKKVYNSAGELIDCTCNGSTNYISSTTCQSHNPQGTCGLADDVACYEVIMCNDGYELLNGKCVADDGCLVSDYSEFEPALNNSACTTVTLAADLDGTGDNKTTALNIGAKTIDGAGHTLTMKSRKIWTRSDNAAVKDINMVWTANNGSAFEINLGFDVEFNNVNIDVTSTASENYALKLDENDGFVMNGKNSIKVRGGTKNRALYMSEDGDLTLSKGATLDIDIVGGSDSAVIYAGTTSRFGIYGDMNIDAEIGKIIDILGSLNLFIYDGGNLDINYKGSKSAISGFGWLDIAEGGKMKLVTNSTDTTLNFERYCYIGGTLEIEAPIADNKYFLSVKYDDEGGFKFTSANAKLITTSTGSRTLSDTDAGVSVILAAAQKGATWQVKSSGYSKTWEAQQDYSGQTAIITAPQSPYWCDATTGCAAATTCTYTSESNCESTNFNSVCTLVSGCYEPTSCEPDNYRNETECKQKTGAYSCQMQKQDPYGCGQAILITFG